MRVKQTLAPSLLVMLFAALLVQLPMAIADRSSALDYFDPMIDVRDVLVRKYVTEPDETAMQKASIQGMLDALDDPYTVYIPPEDLAEFNKDLHGEYVGIGAEVNVVDDYLTIISPMDESPALAAGIMAGDVVLEIEGETTYQISVNECIDKLLGEPGTEVSLLVRHLDRTEEVLTVTRGHIVTRTVKGLRRDGEDWDHCVDGDLGLVYARITQFNASTVADLRNILAQLHEQGMNGLVLDLRDNPGGALPAAVELTNLFLDQGDIVTVRPRAGEERTYAAESAGTLPEFPMVILINGASASASEIVAGALQDHGRARVLGTRSYGKGSVQEVHRLPFNRGTLKITTAHYFRPSGRNINRLRDSAEWGVDPDPGMVVGVTDEEYLQMFRARRDYGIIRDLENHDAPDCADARWIRENLLDEQLALAVDALRSRVSDGSWPAVSDEDPGLLALGQELNRALERRLVYADRLHELEQRINELQSLAAESGDVPLLPADIDLGQGVIAVYDEQGNHVGSFRIDGGNVNLALESLLLTPLSDEAIPAYQNVP